MNYKKNKNSFISKIINLTVKLFFIVLVIKSFFLDAFQIPTSSMENTILPGDFIIVNKAAYKIATPNNIPFTKIDIPSITIISFEKPKANDVVIFKFPKQINNPQYSGANIIKRVIGLPGDTVKIMNKEVYANNKKIINVSTVVFTKKTIKSKNVTDSDIFPKNEKWNSDNYGPLVVPSKGMKVNLNPKNIYRWKDAIEFENGKNSVSVEGTVITINHKAVRSYTFQNDYYFLLGDNRDKSFDSRFWGFVPEKLIFAKTLFIYWSVDPYYKISSIWDFFSAARLNRIGTVIK